MATAALEIYLQNNDDKVYLERIEIDKRTIVSETKYIIFDICSNKNCVLINDKIYDSKIFTRKSPLLCWMCTSCIVYLPANTTYIRAKTNKHFRSLFKSANFENVSYFNGAVSISDKYQKY